MIHVDVHAKQNVHRNHSSLISNDSDGPAWQRTARPVQIEPFTAAVGPAVSISASIVETFQIFFTAALLNSVVEQTNLYAAQVLGEGAASSWTNVSESDILAFLGFAILME